MKKEPSTTSKSSADHPPADLVHLLKGLLLSQVHPSRPIEPLSGCDGLATSDYTNWLNASHGSRDDEVFAGLYGELHRIAKGRMAGEGAGRTLDATGLVHEAWLRLQKSSSQQWQNRKHFYGAATEAMRRILVEAARRRLAAKRGGGEQAEPLDDALPVLAPVADERLLGVHEVLDQLAAEDELKANIVKLRFFGGMKHDEIAAILEVSEPSVRRHWALAKMWLYDTMTDEP